MVWMSNHIAYEFMDANTYSRHIPKSWWDEMKFGKFKSHLSHYYRSACQILQRSDNSAAFVRAVHRPGMNFSKLLIDIQAFSFKKVHLRISAAKWPQCVNNASWDLETFLRHLGCQAIQTDCQVFISKWQYLLAFNLLGCQMAQWCFDCIIIDGGNSAVVERWIWTHMCKTCTTV